MTYENNVHSKIGIYDAVAIFTNSNGNEVHRMTAKMGISEYSEVYEHLFNINVVDRVHAQLMYISYF